MQDIDTMPVNDLIDLAEKQLGFEPEWHDEGVSFLGIATWKTPTGETHALATLREAVKAELERRFGTL